MDVHIRKKLTIAAAVAAAGSLFFALPSYADLTQTDANGAAPPICFATCPTSDSLFHVKLRGTAHDLQFTVYDRNGKETESDTVRRRNSENAWVDPTRVRGVRIILADHSTVVDPASQSHCYFEDNHGLLELATVAGRCTVK